MTEIAYHAASRVVSCNIITFTWLSFFFTNRNNVSVLANVSYWLFVVAVEGVVSSLLVLGRRGTLK